MAAYVIIQSSAVVNVVEWDGVRPYSPGEGLTIVLLSSLPAGATIGWTETDGVWSAPPTPPVPPPDNSPTIAASYAASLMQQADELAAKGQTWEATKLLLKAQGIPS